MPDPLVPPFALVFAKSNPYYMLNSERKKRYRRNMKRDERRKRATLAAFHGVLAAYGDALQVAHRNAPSVELFGLLSVWNDVLEAWSTVAGQVESGKFRTMGNAAVHGNTGPTIEARDNDDCNAEVDFNFNKTSNGNAQEKDSGNTNAKENPIAERNEEDVSPTEKNGQDVHSYKISVLKWLKETEQTARSARREKVEKHLAGTV